MSLLYLGVMKPGSTLGIRLNNTLMKSILLIIKLSRPVFLLGAIVIYALGVGVLSFLGLTIDWGLYLTGQLWALFLQLSTHYLNEYFNAEEDEDNPNPTPFSGGSGALGETALQSKIALIASLTCLASLASITFILVLNYDPDPLVYMIMVLAFLGSFFYSVPPIRLERTGYGELSTSIIVAFLLPAFSFTLQSGELNRLLTMSIFPLTLLHLGMMIILELPDYYTDIKNEKRTLLVRLGWSRGITFYYIVSISAYLLLLIELFLGLPRFVVWHAMLSLPILFLLFWQLIRIRGGAKPNWTSITLTSIASFGTMTYFMAFAYWTH